MNVLIREQLLPASCWHLPTICLDNHMEDQSKSAHARKEPRLPTTEPDIDWSCMGAKLTATSGWIPPYGLINCKCCGVLGAYSCHISIQVPLPTLLQAAACASTPCPSDTCNCCWVATASPQSCKQTYQCKSIGRREKDQCKSLV